jgi:glutamate decarboxylase
MTSEEEFVPLYASVGMKESAPTETIPKEGLPARIAKQLVMDELNLDGNARLNMATFVTSWMEPEADDLMLQAMRKNYIDLDEYSQTSELHKRCVNMMGNLFNAPKPSGGLYTGTGTIGSSEAILLAVLAMKLRWRKQRKSKGLDTNTPNLVFGDNAHIVWKKACLYFDVEMRSVPVSPECLVLTPERAVQVMDENTMGVAVMFASTINGEYENVEEIHEAVAKLNQDNGWNVCMHVDAASGGFIAPFITPELIWDFRLPLVKSINTSGHKFGLVYAGIGWLSFRTEEDLPTELVFHINYLGGDQAVFNMNFSKSASNITGQYYNLVRYGFEGYKALMETGMENAQFLRQGLIDMGIFEIVDKQHIPLVAFMLNEERHYTVFEIQDLLKQRGWIVPAYRCPKGAEEIQIMRVVVKQDFSRDMVSLFLRSMQAAISQLEKRQEKLAPQLHVHHELYQKHSSKSRGTTNVHHRKSGSPTKGVC